MKKNQTGRGRLSSIDLLPDAAQEAVEWAARALMDKDRTQKDILDEFNQRLKEIDSAIDPVSKSAFNRHSLRLSVMSSRLARTREITAAMAERLGAAASDDLTIISAEAIKTLIFELLGEAGEGGFAPIEAMRLAAALKQATQAQHISSDRRIRIEAEFSKKAEMAIDKVAKTKGIASQTVAELKAAFLGMKIENVEVGRSFEDAR